MREAFPTRTWSYTAIGLLHVWAAVAVARSASGLAEALHAMLTGTIGAFLANRWSEASDFHLGGLVVAVAVLGNDGWSIAHGLLSRTDRTTADVSVADVPRPRMDLARAGAAMGLFVILAAIAVGLAPAWRLGFAALVLSAGAMGSLFILLLRTEANASAVAHLRSARTHLENADRDLVAIRAWSERHKLNV